MGLLNGWGSGSGSGVQLLGGDLGGGAGAAGGVLALVFEDGEDLAGLVGLALGLVELGELELSEIGGDGGGLALAELVVEVNGLGVVAGLLIEVGEGVFAESGDAGVPAGGDLLEGLLGGPVLAFVLVGEADEVLGEAAGVGEAVLAGDLLELGVGSGGASLGGGEGLDAGGDGLAGGGDGSLVGLHGLSEGGGGGGGAALVEAVGGNDRDDGNDGDHTVDDGLLAVLFCPVDAGFGEGDKLVLLLQLALGCVIHERSVLQGYKKIAGPTAHASFQFSREGRAGVVARGISGWMGMGSIIAEGSCTDPLPTVFGWA